MSRIYERCKELVAEILAKETKAIVIVKEEKSEGKQ